jgi:hypothetical protein
VSLLFYAWSGDLLGFLPGSWRDYLESSLGVETSGPTDKRLWKIYSPAGFLPAAGWEWCMATALLVAGLTLIYLQRSVLRRRFRMVLLSLRLALLSLLLCLMLPEWRLALRNYGLPTVIVVIDTSRSMATADAIESPGRDSSRWQAATQVLVHPEQGLLTEILQRRNHRILLYAIGDDVTFLGGFSPREQLEATRLIQELRPDAGESRLGSGVRAILEKTPGHRPCALVMVSDFSNTQGESLPAAASASRIPFYLIGVGRPGDHRALRWHDLRVSDSVYAHDTLVFQASLTLEGLPRGASEVPVEVTLREKGKSATLPWPSMQLVLHPGSSPLPVELSYVPEEPGERTFLLEAKPLGDSSFDRVARLERTVNVVPPHRPLKVLFLEGYPRYESRCLRSLCERLLDPVSLKPLIDLHAVRFDSDQPAAGIESLTASLSIKDLETFDVVVISDLDPATLRALDPLVRQLDDFVRNRRVDGELRGGGLLLIAGERHGVKHFQDSSLLGLLPIEIQEAHSSDTLLRPYTLTLSSSHRLDAIFGSAFRSRTSAGELEKFWWMAEGYQPRNGSDLLAEHPQRSNPDNAAGSATPHPLILLRSSGAGRCLFFGCDETWRWRALDGEAFYRGFWLSVLRFLAGVHPGRGRVTLELDRHGDYQEGDRLCLLARLPVEALQAPEAPIQVVMQRLDPATGQLLEVKYLSLHKRADERGRFEVIIDNAQEGSYHFALFAPRLASPPVARCEVHRLPGEMDQPRLDVEAMQATAVASQGQAYLATNLEQLRQELPRGQELPLDTVKDLSLWDHPFVWGLILALLFSEWFLRRRQGAI